MSEYIQHNQTVITFDSDESWVILSPIELSIKQKIETIGTPLKNWDISINYGIKTGFNDAFIISGEKKDELISQDPKSAEIIRPILRGRDIKRYSYKFADLWIILAGYGSYKYLESEYPVIYNHLLSHKEKLEQRGQCRYTSSGKVNSKKDYPGQHHWLELDNNPSQEYLDDFSKQKIVWGNLCLSAQYTIAEEGLFISAPSPVITNGNKYLLAVLNSKVADWYVRQLGVTRNGGYFEYKPMFVEKIPIPIIDDDSISTYESYVEEIIQLKNDGKDCSELEYKIDCMVCDLYGLTFEEAEYLGIMSRYL